MLNRNLLVAVGAVFALAIGAAAPAAAQSHIGEDRAVGSASGSITDPLRAPTNRNATPSRLTPRQERRQPAAAPTPEQVMAEAQALMSAAGSSCQVSQANRLGDNAEKQALYEVGCGAGEGFIVLGSTPPESYACLELLGQAESARARDPAADVGLQCAMPHNIDTVTLIGAFARDAGVTCAVDQAAMIGKNENNVVYEVGCPGADGYWLEKAPTGWILTDCTEVVMTNSTCRFTTADEQAASFQAKLAGTDASDCQVQQVRLMGHNANGKFYEAKCAAGDGYIARLNTEGVTQQVYACSTAQHVGGGCTLTGASATAAAPAPTTDEQ